MKKRVSSYDVAREAGVSRATVSYVLNNIDGVKIKPETREKVLKAAQKLKYYPDSIAKALRTSRSMTVGVVTHRNVSEERFSKVLEGIKKVLSENSYSILLCSDEFNNNGYPEFYRYYKEKKIDGIILLSHIEFINLEENEKTIELIIKDNIPSVFVDYHLNNTAVNCVDIDYFNGSYIAAKYLTEKGHRKIIYLYPGFDTVQENERLRGVKKAFSDFELNIDNLMVVSAIKNDVYDWEHVISILKDNGDYTALIASWVNYGFKVLYLANKIGIKVPGDLAVVALAGSSFAEYCYPRLSTSDLPLYDIGRNSAEVLIDAMNNQAEPVAIKLPCHLEIRESG